MKFLNSFFGKRNKKQREDPQENIEKKQPIKSTNAGIKIALSSNDNGTSISSTPIGEITGSTADDFYVYEWFIKDTGEVFYVGKGRGDRYKAFHNRAYEAEKIRRNFDTSYRFVGTNLTEEQAVELESKEISRILNETNDRLTNRIVPYLTKRDNGYNPSPKTPELKFETAPFLYASEIEEHYFGITPRSFDRVDPENLKRIVLISKSIRDEVNIVYNGKLDDYLAQTRALLSKNGSIILKSKFAKSVSAWVYIGDDYLSNFERDQELALEKLGRNIPTYHLIDVWKYLGSVYGDTGEISTEVLVNPSHNRVPLTDIKNLQNWEKGYDEGQPFWEEGEKERKEGNLQRAIALFDKARYNGYDAPALYRSYAMAYRKLKDYDNEVAIIDEAIERASDQNNTTIRQLRERRIKALELKQKSEISIR